MQVQMFDVGMNEGEVTAMMIATLRKLHVKDWVIHGFEPHPKWFAHCKHRFRKYPNVHVYPLAIGERDGKAKLFHATKNTVGHSLYDDKFNVDPLRYDTVSVCRFSAWLDEQLWSRHAVNILKMNIEGAEWSVYRDLVESNWHMHFDFFLGTPGDEDDISKIAHLKSRRDAYDQFLRNNKILVKRYTDYIPDRNWDLQRNLANRLRQKRELRSKLLITAFCTELYSAYLPFLAYSAHHLPGSPPVRIYAPAEDVSACQRQLDEIVNRLGIDAEVLPYTRFTAARCYDDQTCKMLRWLIWDPQWADYDGVLMTDVDMVLTDKLLLESRLRHAQDIKKPYSNVIRALRDSAGNLKMQGVHFFKPSAYGHIVKPIADHIANQMNTRTLQKVNNEVVLANMMEEAFGMPSFSRHEVNSHHHGVHVKAFNPSGYSFRQLDTFVDSEHLGAAFRKLAQGSEFQRLKSQSPRDIRRQLNRAMRYSRYLQFCKLFSKLRRVNAKLQALRRRIYRKRFGQPRYHTFNSYDEYVESQRKTNQAKQTSVWVQKSELELVADAIRTRCKPTQFGICHGVRTGVEVKFLRETLGCEVIGTEISNSATEVEHVIEWDFHEVKEEWVGCLDFIYSNSFDHSYDPNYCLKQWLSCLRPDGLCFIHWGDGHNHHDFGMNNADCFQAPKQMYIQMIRSLGQFHGEIHSPVGGGRSVLIAGPKVQARSVRIAFVTPEFPTEFATAGGLSTYLGRMSRTLVSLGHHVEVFTISQERSEVVEFHGVRVQRVHAPAARWWEQVCALPGMLWPRLRLSRAFAVSREAAALAAALEQRHQALPFDLVQSSDYRLAGMCITARPHRTHVVRCSLTENVIGEVMGVRPGLDSLWNGRRERQWLQSVDFVYAPSRFLAEYQQSHHGVSVGVVRPPFFFETETAERVACRLPERYLFHFGNIGRAKGSDVVAAALTLAWQEEPDLTMVWAGKLPQGQEFATKYPKLAAERERCTWLGPLQKSELYGVLQKAVAVVAPSRCDNLPNNVLESLACGVPVIGSAGASIEEVVEDPVHGELVPIEDVTALAQSLLRAWHSEPPFDGRIFPALSDDFEPRRAAQRLLDYVGGDQSSKGSRPAEEFAQAVPA